MGPRKQVREYLRLCSFFVVSLLCLFLSFQGSLLQFTVV